MCVDVCNRKKDLDNEASAASADDADRGYKYETCYQNRQCRLEGLKGACW